MPKQGFVLWFTGLSGAGKTTLARALACEPEYAGHTLILDGDDLRAGVTADLGFSREDRGENLRRTSEIAALAARQGFIVVVALISPYREDRVNASKIIGESKFFEVYLSASFETCATRDCKGLYAKALRGEIPSFTGLSAPYEPPTSPALELNTAELSVRECLERLKKLQPL